MSCFLLLLFLIIFSRIEIKKSGKFNTDYISRDGTAYIKGIFAFLIILSHSKAYIDLNSPIDKPYVLFQDHINQMVVAMFLFYSGYGIMEQIKQKRFDYIKSIASKRFPQLLLKYDIAAIMYVFLNFAIKKPFSLKHFLLSLTAWEGIGGTSWYIFTMLAFYIITSLSFLPLRKIQNNKHYFASIVICCLLTAIYAVILTQYGDKDTYWISTIHLYHLGLLYSYFKNRIEKLVMKNGITYYSILTAAVMLYIIFYLRCFDELYFYQLWAIMFTVTVVLITMKVRLKSQILKWFGEHAFGLYVMQRLPMIYFNNIGLSKIHKYIFIIVSFAAAVLITMIYDSLMKKLVDKIWKNKNPAF